MPTTGLSVDLLCMNNGFAGRKAGLASWKALFGAALAAVGLSLPAAHAAVAVCNATVVPCSGNGVCNDVGGCNCNILYFGQDCSINAARELGAVWTVWMVLVWTPYIVVVALGTKYLYKRFSGRSFKKLPVNQREWLLIGNIAGCLLRMLWAIDPKALWLYSRGAEVILLRIPQHLWLGLVLVLVQVWDGLVKGTRGAKPSKQLRCGSLVIGVVFFIASAVMTFGAATSGQNQGKDAQYYFTQLGDMVEAVYIAVLIPIGVLYAAKLLRMLDQHSSSDSIVKIMQLVFRTIAITVVDGIVVILFVTLQLVLSWQFREGEPKGGAIAMLFVIHAGCEPVFVATILYVSTSTVKKDGQQRGAVSMAKIGVKGSRHGSGTTRSRSRDRGSSSEGQISTVNPISEAEAASTGSVPEAHGTTGAPEPPRDNSVP